MNGDGAEKYPEVAAEVQADDGILDINSGVIYCEWHGGEPIGVRIYGWPDKIHLLVGFDDGESKATIGESLTPEQAREIAFALETQADKVESNLENDDQEPSGDEKSLLRRLGRRMVGMEVQE